MSAELKQIIEYESEGANLDFKKEEYNLGKNPKKNEFLKDISAFANHPSDSDKYIIIGIKEKDGIKSEPFEIINLTDEATYQQFIYDNIEPKINFEYKSTIYKDKQIAYFRIFGNKSRPYLFKRNIQNPTTNNSEFKKGDGFIKVGSSTKKLDRSDFENIYEKRFSRKDRKGDLDIEAYFGIPDNKKIINLGLKYIDIRITNRSNKSIDFNIEMKVFHKKKHVLITEDDIINELQKDNSNHFAYSTFTHQVINLEVSYEEKQDYVLVSRNFTRQQKTAISLPQGSTEIDIFRKYLLLLNKDADEINAEVTIRSDDFTEGPLIEKLIFKK